MYKSLGFGYSHENSGYMYQSFDSSQKIAKFGCIVFTYMSLLSDGWLLTSTF